VFIAPMAGTCGFPGDHRLFAGHLSPMRERIVAALGGHDLVLAIGAPAFTYHVAGDGPHVPPGTQLCQLIDDPDTAAWAPQGSAVLCSLRLGLLDLLARPAPHTRTDPAPWRKAARVEASRAEKRLSVAYVLQTLADLRDPGSIIVEEAPSARAVMHERLPILRSGTFYEMCSGGLGFGMAAAAGVALAQPDARVIALIGDGSAMYTIQALWNAAQAKLPITFLILNNGRYAALQDFAPRFGFAAGVKPEGSDLPGLDFLALAAGHGVPAQRVRGVAHLHDALPAALRADGPVLLDIEVA
jgi:benzoylformate decarboxylase